MPCRLPLGVSTLRVEVGVRIEPQHPQPPALLAAVARDRGDRADREAVIAAEQDRQAAGAQFAVHGVVHQPVPLGHLGEVTIALDRRQARVAGAGEVAAIEHLEPLRLERFLQPGDAQRLRAHRCAARAGADVGRRADQRDRVVP